jgi:hypothetical protein
MWRGMVRFAATCSVAERQSPQVDERDARERRYPATYRPLQHGITDAPSSAEGVWRYLRATIPERSGVWILDGSSGPTQGRRSDAVSRQYCGTLGQAANYQVAVMAALWSGVQGWVLAAALCMCWGASVPRSRRSLRARCRSFENG